LDRDWETLVTVSADLSGQLDVDQILESLLQQPAEQLLGAIVAETCQQIGVG
jgi:hypothetical protein